MVESRCGAVAVGRAYPLSAPFVWRCLNSQTVTPFPHPAHRTGQAQLTHPALGQDILPSHTEGRDDAVQPTARTVASSGLWSRPALKTDDDTQAGNHHSTFLRGTLTDQITHHYRASGNANTYA